LGNGALVPIILDRIFLEDFISDGFQVICQRLERRLEIVLIAGTKLFDGCPKGLVPLEIADVDEMSC
jgi:hypothetical protein